MRVHLSIVFEFHKRSMEPIRKVFEKNGVSASYNYTNEDIAIMADAGCPRMAKKLYNVNHGFGSKNSFWINSTWNNELNIREGEITHLVPSQWFKDRLEALGRKALVVGVPRLDKAFHTSTKGGIFYSSTCHFELCSLFYIGERINELGKVKVGIHPFVKERVKSVESIFDNIVDGDQSIHISEADIVIGDYATSVLDSIALGKPTIVFEMGCYKKTHWYNPQNVEVLFSDSMYIAKSFDDVKRYVDMIRSGEDPKKQKREQSAKLLCEFCGVASEQLYKVVTEDACKS